MTSPGAMPDLFTNNPIDMHSALGDNGGTVAAPDIRDTASAVGSYDSSIGFWTPSLAVAGAVGSAVVQRKVKPLSPAIEAKLRSHLVNPSNPVSLDDAKAGVEKARARGIDDKEFVSKLRERSAEKMASDKASIMKDWNDVVKGAGKKVGANPIVKTAGNLGKKVPVAGKSVAWLAQKKAVQSASIRMAGVGARLGLRMACLAIPGPGWAVGAALTVGMWLFDPEGRAMVWSLMGLGAPSVDDRPERAPGTPYLNLIDPGTASEGTAGPSKWWLAAGVAPGLAMMAAKGGTAAHGPWATTTQYLPVTGDGSRDVMVRTRDAELQMVNNTLFGIDPEHTWPQEPKISVTPDLGAAIGKVNELLDVGLTLSNELKGLFQEYGANEPTVAKYYQNAEPSLKALSTVGPTVLLPLGEAISTAAAALNDAYQSVRTQNTQARNAIAKTGSGIWPPQFTQVDESGLQKMSLVVDDAQRKIDEAQKKALGAAAAWVKTRPIGTGAPAESWIPKPPVETKSAAPTDTNKDADKGDEAKTATPAGPTSTTAPSPTLGGGGAPSAAPSLGAPSGGGGSPGRDVQSILDEARKNPMGQNQNPFGQNPFGQNPFGNMMGQNPFGQNPFGQQNQPQKKSSLEDLLARDLKGKGGDRGAAPEKKTMPTIGDKDKDKAKDSEKKKAEDDKEKKSDKTEVDDKAKDKNSPVATPLGGDDKPDTPPTEPAKGGKPEDTSTVKIDGKDTKFPDEKTAKMVRDLYPQDGGTAPTIEKAAGDNGFKVPPAGHDIGKVISTAELRPGDAVIGADHKGIYLGDQRVLADGKVMPLSEVASFSGPHQGLFRFEGLDGAAPAPAVPGADPATPPAPAPGVPAPDAGAAPPAPGATPPPAAGGAPVPDSSTFDVPEPGKTGDQPVSGQVSGQPPAPTPGGSGDGLAPHPGPGAPPPPQPDHDLPPAGAVGGEGAKAAADLLTGQKDTAPATSPDTGDQGGAGPIPTGD